MIKQAQRNIYLSGGGDEHASFLLDSSFFSRIEQGGDLLYIPIALRGNRLFDYCEDWFKAVLNAHGRDDINVTTWKNIDAMQFTLLNEVSAVYVGGGNTWSLMKELVESGLDHYLKKYIEEGGLYYGGSAGAIVLGLRVDTQDDPNTCDWSTNEGLNVLQGTSVACHVKDEDLEKVLNGLHSLGPIIALSETAGVYFNGNTFSCYGSGVCEHSV